MLIGALGEAERASWKPCFTVRASARISVIFRREHGKPE